MPFKSEAQRKYLWKNEPEIAKKWTAEYGGTPKRADGRSDMRRVKPAAKRLMQGT